MAGYVVRMVEIIPAYSILVGKPEESISLSEYLEVGVNIQLKQILGKQSLLLWTGFNCLNKGTRGGPFRTQ
jgi:hypothetical protein